MLDSLHAEKSARTRTDISRMLAASRGTDGSNPVPSSGESYKPDPRDRSPPLMLALGSAFLFGASTPIAKLLLGITDPLLLAGLLYLGSGVGIALVATGEPLPFSSHLSGVFCAESHRRLDAVLLHIKARARQGRLATGRGMARRGRGAARECRCSIAEQRQVRLRCAN